MLTIPLHPRTTQVALFRPPLPLPCWLELAEPTRQEAVQLLAQLLCQVHTSPRPCPLSSPGECDE
jgi:hypothetical protein